MYQWIRLADFVAGARLARKAAFDEGEVLRHAAAHSRFYRERLDPGAPLAAQPTLDKATMMEHYDDVVTDPRLRRDALLAHVEHAQGDELYLGRYRAMTTSGSSGRKGLFVYGRAEWAAIMAQFLRYTALSGVKPRIPRLRVAVIVSPNAAHMSRRVAQTASLGVHRVLTLSVTAPLATLVERLNAFQPQSLGAYPSIAALLASEQQAGRLRIAPELISTASELQTPEMAASIEAAFGVRPHNLYATTEGLWGTDCAEHAGVHLFEDFTRVENVDAGGRPVPDGRPGEKLLDHEPLQPHPAADPARGRRRRDAHRRAVRVRSPRPPDQGDRRPQRRRDRARRRAPAPAAVRARRAGSRRGRVPGRAVRLAGAGARRRPRRRGRGAPAHRRGGAPA